MGPIALDPTSLALIQQCVYRYALALDEADFELLAECFTEDAVVRFPAHRGGDRVVGRESLLERYRAMRARRGRGRMFVSNVVVLDAGPHEVVVASYVASTTTDADGVRVSKTGWYRDRIVREPDGGWRIKERTVGGDEPDGSTASPLTPAP